MRTLSRTPLCALAALAVSCKDRSFHDDANLQDAYLTTTARGRKTVTYRSPAGVTEQCVATKHFPGVKYDKDDEKDEDKLCNLNFYKAPAAADAGEAVALCPKMSSTFPGVEVYELDGRDKGTYESRDCRNQDNRPTDRLAKFKQSVSCCYTGSILAYYHLSRIFGDAVNVPTAVIRTMDVAQHKTIADRGASWSSDLNQQLWSQVRGYDANPRRRDNYFTSDLKAVFGAMSVNPKGEERYAEINQNAADPATARRNFLAKPQVQRVFTAQGVGAMAQRNLASAAPIIQQMRDISDLILMDYLMQQQDRFGNIHYTEYYYYLDANGDVDKVKIKRNGNTITTPKPTPDAVAVKRMLLKDNDCGSRSGNPKAFTLDEVKRMRHLSLRTYKGLRYLAQQWRAGTAKPFFETEALLNTPDALDNEGIDGFGNRLLAAADALYNSCKAGNLLLDLSIEDHLKSQNMPDMVKQKCEEILTPDGDTDTPTAPVATPTPTFTPKSCKVASPTDHRATVRKTPDSNGEQYMVLNDGAVVTAVAQSGNWYSVEYRLNQMDHGARHGRPAWIHSSLLQCR